MIMKLGLRKRFHSIGIGASQVDSLYSHHEKWRLAFLMRAGTSLFLLSLFSMPAKAQAARPLDSRVLRQSSENESPDLNGRQPRTDIPTGQIRCKNLEKIRCVDGGAAGYRTLEAALSGLARGTILISDGFRETITDPILLLNVRVMVMPGAALTIGTGGSITLSNEAFWDGPGSTLRVKKTSGDAVIVVGGWTTLTLERLVGPKSGNGNGLVFRGGEFSRATISEISGFSGGDGVLFTGIGAAQNTVENVVYVEGNLSNSIGVFWQGEARRGDFPCEDNRYYGGLVIGNTTAQVRFGDSNVYGGYEPQFNKFYGVAHSTTAVTAVVFQNAVLNWFEGSALVTLGSPPSISFSNAPNNFVNAQPTQTGISGVPNSLVFFGGTSSRGMNLFGMGIDNEGGNFLVRDGTTKADYWWERFTPGGNVQFFGGADVPANPSLNVNGILNARTAPGIYTASGKEQSGAHIVSDRATLFGGTVTMRFSSGAIFTSSTSYSCTANDDTKPAPIEIVQDSGSSVTFAGTSGDSFHYICAGT